LGPQFNQKKLKEGHVLTSGNGEGRCLRELLIYVGKNGPDVRGP